MLKNNEDYIRDDKNESKSALDFGFFFSGTRTPNSRFLELCTGFQRPGFRISQQKYAALRIPQA